jgi:hypothetical protein
VELVGGEIDSGKLGVGDLDRPLVDVLVELGVDLQPGGRCRGSDQ